MEWSDWFQGVAGKVVDSQLAQQQAPIELERLKLQAYGPYGQPYTEGQANQTATVASTVGAIPMQWLLIGGVVLLVLMDD